MNQEIIIADQIATRFRGFLPVVIDVETAGLCPATDALLEIAAIFLPINPQGLFSIGETLHCHVIPFEGARLDPEAMAIHQIDPDHPFRAAIPECDVLKTILTPIRKAIKANHCQRAVLVGHNAPFDLGFIQAAIKRCNYKRDPFHPFTTLDTATLAAVALEHTVLSVACKRAGIAFDDNEAHSALYDATKTAELFCFIVNQWTQSRT